MKLLINIDVSDLPAAVAFYQAAFGLAPGRRFGGDVVEMVGATAPIYLLAKAARTASSPHAAARAAPALTARDYRRHWTPVHLDVVVDDLDLALQRALNAGAQLEKPPSTATWGRMAQLADPFGHGFCLLQFLNRGYDEIAN